MMRSDALPKANGAIPFGTDLSVPGMLWASFAVAPHPRARLLHIDPTGARAVPGVVDVLTASDVTSLAPKAVMDPQRPLLVVGESLFAGQPFALVAADSAVAARRGARALGAATRWEVLPAFTELDRNFPAWPDRERMSSEGHVNGHVRAHRGDFEKLARSCEVVHEEVYRTSMVAQVALEPHACLARVTAEDWHVVSSSQTPFGLREDLVDKLGVPSEKLRVEGSWVGGGFGGKNEALLEAHALLMSKKTGGRPVRIALSYREEFLFSRTTQPAIFWMTSCARGGRLVGRRTRLLLDTGASLPGRDFALGYALGFTLGPYRLEAWELEGYALRTNRPPFGPHRAPFAPQCVFAAEGHLDSLARLAGRDPGEFREEALWRTGERTCFGQPIPPFGAHEALRRAREVARRWRAEVPPGHGIGLAVAFWSTGTSAGGEARVRLGPRGLWILEGEREIGNGTIVHGLPRVAEIATGLPPEAVTVEYGDTSHAPFDSGVWGSRTISALGRAVEKACHQVLEELARRARGRPRGRLPVLTLSFSAGEVKVQADGKEVPWASLLNEDERRAGGIEALGKEYGGHGALDTSCVDEGELYPYSDLIAAVHVAQVEVDRETGAVHVDRLAAFHDAGKVLDPPGFRGQVEGGVVMGIGTALSEEGLITPEGRLANPGLLDYRIPTLHDVPTRLEVVAIEGFLGSGPQGAKGIGEPPIIPVAAAVANAVADATGARVLELPLTPERVARALGLISPGAPRPAARAPRGGGP
jgi:CO/xanthine dehydrogenase Mo-binding subunit